jgi:hypothetical protein
MKLAYRGKIWLALFIVMTSFWSSLLYFLYALMDL